MSYAIFLIYAHNQLREGITIQPLRESITREGITIRPLMDAALKKYKGAVNQILRSSIVV